MLNTNFLKRLPDDVLNTIADAQMADLIERRHIQDPKLFRECFDECFDNDPEPDENAAWEDVMNFSDIAAKAFVKYHAKRAEQKADAEAQAQADEYEEANAEDAENEDEI